MNYNHCDIFSQITAWPGEDVKVNVTSKDELNGATGSVIRLKYHSIDEVYLKAFVLMCHIHLHSLVTIDFAVCFCDSRQSINLMPFP